MYANGFHILSFLVNSFEVSRS